MSRRHLRRICVIGMPLGLEYSVCSIGNVVLQSSINTLGTVVAAAQICGERIRAIATMPMESVGMAMATYVGRNYGAKRMDRIKSGIRAGLVIQATYSLAAWVVLLLLKKPLVYLLAVRFDSFLLICVSSPMAWVPALLCCMALCAYDIPRETRKFEIQCGR